MLITSHFHDYYDKITAWGIDKTVVYRRDESGPEELKSGSRIYGHNWRDKKGIELRACRIIGFCGKLYPLLEIKYRKTHKIIYDPVKAKQAAGEDWSQSRYNFHYSSVEESFDVANYKDLLPLFIDRKCPVFIYGDYLEDKYPGDSQQLILNPKLKNYGFQSVKDPVTAFQEIYMYISGVIGIESKPMVEIADKYKAIAHGHDHKYSFRREPEKK